MLENIIKLIPGGIRRTIINKILSVLSAKHRREIEAIQYFSFSQKHIAKTQLLINREALLKVLPQNAVVAELGVNRGDFAERILELTTPRKLHLVDAWNTVRYSDQKRINVINRFDKEIKSGKVEVNVGLSTEVVSQFPDSYFDWIYIDTDHEYETTIEELKAYENKMKAGAIICGHDFSKGNWKDMSRHGVIEAVTEFCNNYNWELKYLTSEFDRAPSFAIQKID